jgi:hypothetical protein
MKKPAPKPQGLIVAIAGQVETRIADIRSADKRIASAEAALATMKANRAALFEAYKADKAKWNEEAVLTKAE